MSALFLFAMPAELLSNADLRCRVTQPVRFDRGPDNTTQIRVMAKISLLVEKQINNSDRTRRRRRRSVREMQMRDFHRRDYKVFYYSSRLIFFHFSFLHLLTLDSDFELCAVVSTILVALCSARSHLRATTNLSNSSDSLHRVCWWPSPIIKHLIYRLTKINREILSFHIYTIRYMDIWCERVSPRTRDRSRRDISYRKWMARKERKGILVR